MEHPGSLRGHRVRLRHAAPPVDPDDAPVGGHSDGGEGLVEADIGTEFCDRLLQGGPRVLGDEAVAQVVREERGLVQAPHERLELRPERGGAEGGEQGFEALGLRFDPRGAGAGSQAGLRDGAEHRAGSGVGEEKVEARRPLPEEGLLDEAHVLAARQRGQVDALRILRPRLQLEVRVRFVGELFVARAEEDAGPGAGQGVDELGLDLRVVPQRHGGALQARHAPHQAAQRGREDHPPGEEVVVPLLLDDLRVVLDPRAAVGVPAQQVVRDAQRVQDRDPPVGLDALGERPRQRPPGPGILFDEGFERP